MENGFAGRNRIVEPFFFMALDHLMRSLVWEGLTSPWLDDCVCCLVVFSHVLAMLITHCLHSWMVVEHTISLWCGLVYMLYWIWMMVLGPQGVE